MVDTTMDALSTVRKQVEQADTDLLRGIVKLFCEPVIGQEVDANCGAPYGERSEERTDRRNGYRTQGLGHADRDDPPFRPEVGRNQGQHRTVNRRSRNRS